MIKSGSHRIDGSANVLSSYQAELSQVSFADRRLSKSSGASYSDTSVSTVVQGSTSAAMMARPLVVDTRSGATSALGQRLSSSGRNSLPIVHFMAGGMGGVLGAVMTSPLEVVKTRLQSTTYVSSYGNAMARCAPPYHYSVSSHGVAHGGASRGGRSVYAMALSVPINISRHVTTTLDVMRSIYKTEGCLALWKGLGPSLMGVAPSRAMNFGTYSWVKEYLSQTRSRPTRQEDTTWIHITSALCAGIVSATITNPLWMIKTRLQLQSDLEVSTGTYRTSYQCLAALVRTEGLSSLYRGLSASYLGTMETVVQLVLYERMKSAKRERDVRDLMMTATPSLDYETACRRAAERKRTVSDWTSYLTMAALAKLLASIGTYPHEVLRTRLRQPAGPDGVNPYESLGNTVRLMLRQEGYRAFYSGLTAHLLRVVPNAAIMFLTYEAVIHTFSHLRSGVNTMP